MAGWSAALPGYFDGHIPDPTDPTAFLDHPNATNATGNRPPDPGLPLTPADAMYFAAKTLGFLYDNAAYAWTGGDGPAPSVLGQAMAGGLDAGVGLAVGAYSPPLGVVYTIGDTVYHTIDDYMAAQATARQAAAIGADIAATDTAAHTAIGPWLDALTRKGYFNPDTVTAHNQDPGNAGTQYTVPDCDIGQQATMVPDGRGGMTVTTEWAQQGDDSVLHAAYNAIADAKIGTVPGFTDAYGESVDQAVRPGQ
jgi:hypothetical protein